MPVPGYQFALDQFRGYQEYEQMATRVRTNPLKKSLDAATARLALLEHAFLHWYAVKKDVNGPCKQCGLVYEDRIHRDNVQTS